MQNITTTIRSMLTNVDVAIKAREKYMACLAKAREHFAGKSREDVRTTLVPIVGEFRAVPIVDGERKAKGTKVLDSSAKHYPTAKRDLTRLLLDICGPVSADSAPSEPTKQKASADEKAAAKALLKACKGDLARAKAILKAVA